ncbi:hypothetical protein ORJ00_10010 [Rheinheimera baltica]|uniref:hypothetical protein n=1 Tax=Rheinheimera baltica TaxID=67576 RepID=UPI0027401720|nr:hypothetical protein [Rheinheimera baltica]MDP5143078.1 hypothetical protein [Rheinheimera baltica]
MNILFLGFSVTAEDNGYFKYIDIPNAKIEKVALGGVQPHHLAYLVGSILEKNNYDIVIFEIATAGFRSFLSEQMYLFSLVYVLRVALSKGITPILLDIPRADLDIKNDWVFAINSKVSRLFDILRFNISDVVDDISPYLRDGIHTNESGARFVGKYFSDAFNRLDYRVNPGFLNPIFNVIDNVSLDLIIPLESGLDVIEFSRSGYSAVYSKLEGNTRKIKIQLSGLFGHGVSYLLGPDTGVLKINDASKSINVTCRDEFSYYTRAGYNYFKDRELQGDVFIETLDIVPNVTLKKGFGSNERPVNYVGGLLVSSVSYNEIVRISKELIGLL